MFTNKSTDGRNNICGTVVAKLRKELCISQRELADRLKSGGLEIDKNAIQRIESGQRFVTDIELIFISKVLNVTINDLLGI
ncbi:MAG: helix-turn-helix domain-containing protein [Oscillospiraceae bacterium]